MKLIKILERLAVNFLLKRGYQVTFPKIYFSDSNNKYTYFQTRWEGKK